MKNDRTVSKTDSWMECVACQSLPWTCRVLVAFCLVFFGLWVVCGDGIVLQPVCYTTICPRWPWASCSWAWDPLGRRGAAEPSSLFQMLLYLGFLLSSSLCSYIYLHAFFPPKLCWAGSFETLITLFSLVPPVSPLSPGRNGADFIWLFRFLLLLRIFQ